MSTGACRVSDLSFSLALAKILACTVLQSVRPRSISDGIVEENLPNMRTCDLKAWRRLKSVGFDTVFTETTPPLFPSAAK
jgi:hypothetical protein